MNDVVVIVFPGDRVSEHLVQRPPGALCKQVVSRDIRTFNCPDRHWSLATSKECLSKRNDLRQFLIIFGGSIFD